ncbi:DNA-directed RNA polymerase subunit A' [archaeon]|nr:DNA-directed RNA polymerase subunit A' [archaeon]
MSKMIESINFGFLSPKMIKEMAAVKIDKPELYDPDGYPIDGGLADLHLGVIDPGLRCRVCAGAIGQCLGHFGYLELTKPVVHPLYGKHIFMMLKSTCSKCGKILSDKVDASNHMSLTLAYKTTKAKCSACGEKQKTLKFQKPTSYREGHEELTSEEVRRRLEMITDDDAKLFGIKGGRPEWYVLTILPVPPVTVRPSITLETGSRSEDDLTHKLVDVVRINERLRKNLELGAPEFIIRDIWELLQYHVSTLMDNEISTLPPARHRSGRSLKTIVQRLGKKEGRFRSNLTGKRVNFSSRAVISPDPKLSINEVGIPFYVAKDLTIPIGVTKNNLDELKKLVLNGSDVHPGANYVVRSDGVKKKITEENKEDIIKELTGGYVIERHLQDGDIALFNRQPSLHRMSIMAHRIKVLEGKTFRMNLCVTVPYNADFDGDEMNLHIPQTEEAQTEAEMLMLVEKHIRSPRYGLPIISCKDDHITGCYLLTKKDSKFSKREATELLMAVDMHDKIDEIKGTVTGKELFSLLLPKDFNIKFKSATCIGCSKCEKEGCPYDSYVVIENGVLKKGIIDENSLGEMKGKIIDKLDTLYDSSVVRKFFDSVALLAIEILTRKGFSISIDDMDIDPQHLKKIESIKDKYFERSQETLAAFAKGKIPLIPGMSKEETLETMMQEIGSGIINETGTIVRNNIPFNSAVIMARTGAKGSFVNLSQIISAVGQESLEGKRIHRGYNDRTLSHFKINDLGLAASGFVRSGYKKGLRPIEFFFDAMNSRENLMDKSLHTRHSGYMERRLVNAMQDLHVDNDMTVRDGSGNIVQFRVAEDGFNPMKVHSGKLDVEWLLG